MLAQIVTGAATGSDIALLIGCVVAVMAAAYTATQRAWASALLDAAVALIALGLLVV